MSELNINTINKLDEDTVKTFAEGCYNLTIDLKNQMTVDEFIKATDETNQLGALLYPEIMQVLNHLHENCWDIEGYGIGYDHEDKSFVLVVNTTEVFASSPWQKHHMTYPISLGENGLSSWNPMDWCWFPVNPSEVAGIE